MTRARLIVNPDAGTDRATSLLPLVNARLRSLVEEVDVTVTISGDDVEQAAARTLSEGCDALFVAGGDGTLNRVLRGLMGADGRMPAMPIGVVPTGTGNDFVKALGLGESVEPALDALTDPHLVDVDIGTMNGVPFINASAGGFVADVSDAVTGRLKDTTGKLAYLIGGARALLGSEPFAARIAMAGGAGDLPGSLAGSQDLRMFAVSNARFIGGGYPIAPGAVIDDGLLDVLVVPHLPTLEVVGVLQRIAAGGDRGDGVLHFRAAAFDLEFSRSVRVNTDGEVLDTAAARYRVLHRAARFFCGRAPSAAAPPAAWRR